MWVHPVAIRPIPPYAVVSEAAVERAREEVSKAEDDADALESIHSELINEQPILADYLTGILSTDLDETALALGFFLSLVIWKSFRRVFGERLRQVDQEGVESMTSTLTAEEELRAQNGREPIDWEDIALVDQPHIAALMNQQIETALGIDDTEIDLDDVHTVFRALVLMTLALSYAVDGPAHDREVLA